MAVDGYDPVPNAENDLRPDPADTGLEHVGYRYRPPESLVSHLYKWYYAKASEADDMEALAARGWQVERLYRRCEDD